MKHLFFFVMLCTLISCDPPLILIVENQSDSNIQFEVSTRNPIRFDSLYYCDSLITDKRVKFHNVSNFFVHKRKIEKMDSLNYTFTLNPREEVLISPSTIGMPFTRLTYELRGKTYNLIREARVASGNFEIKNKPIRISIVKIYGEI